MMPSQRSSRTRSSMIRLVATTSLLVGFGPFVCNDSTVEEARRELKGSGNLTAPKTANTVPPKSPQPPSAQPGHQAPVQPGQPPQEQKPKELGPDISSDALQANSMRALNILKGQKSMRPLGAFVECAKSKGTPKECCDEAKGTWKTSSGYACDGPEFGCVCVDAKATTARGNSGGDREENLVKAAVPEIKLLLGQIHMGGRNYKLAQDILNDAYSLVAELDVKQEKSAKKGEEDEPTEADLQLAKRIKKLRGRIAFSLGLIAVAEKRWEDAQVEFLRVLSINPRDEDARWNLELAWHQANPPCHKRDDDHEPDNSRAEVKPYNPEKAKDRVLCPNNEDWYQVDGKKDSMLFVNIDGSVDKKDMDDFRDIDLVLYKAGSERPLRRSKVKNGKATVGLTNIREDGTYHFSIGGQGTAEYKYAVRVEVVPPCPVDDAEEENDSAQTAKDVADGDKGGLKACPNDDDWYRIKVPAKEARQVQVMFDPSRSTLQAVLYETDGKTERATAKMGKGGLAVTISKDEKEQEVLLKINTVGENENTYGLKIGPPQDNNDQNQDQNKDKNQDKNKDKNQDQDQKQNKDKKEEQKQPQDQMDMKRLIDALDKQKKNPQLEKALRNIRVVPQLEDY